MRSLVPLKFPWKLSISVERNRMEYLGRSHTRHALDFLSAWTHPTRPGSAPPMSTSRATRLGRVFSRPRSASCTCWKERLGGGFRVRPVGHLPGAFTEKNGFVTATKLGTTNIFFCCCNQKYCCSNQRFC